MGKNALLHRLVVSKVAFQYGYITLARLQVAWFGYGRACDILYTCPMYKGAWRLRSEDGQPGWSTRLGLMLIDPCTRQTISRSLFLAERIYRRLQIWQVSSDHDESYATWICTYASCTVQSGRKRRRIRSSRVNGLGFCQRYSQDFQWSQILQHTRCERNNTVVLKVSVDVPSVEKEWKDRTASAEFSGEPFTAEKSTSTMRSLIAKQLLQRYLNGVMSSTPEGAYSAHQLEYPIFHMNVLTGYVRCPTIHRSRLTFWDFPYKKRRTPWGLEHRPHRTFRGGGFVENTYIVKDTYSTDNTLRGAIEHG